LGWETWYTVCLLPLHRCTPSAPPCLCQIALHLSAPDSTNILRAGHILRLPWRSPIRLSTFGRKGQLEDFLPPQMCPSVHLCSLYHTCGVAVVACDLHPLRCNSARVKIITATPSVTNDWGPSGSSRSTAEYTQWLPVLGRERTGRWSEHQLGGNVCEMIKS